MSDAPSAAASRPEDPAVTSQELVAHISPPRQEPRTDRAHLSTGEVMRYEPMTPMEIAFCIEEIQEALGRYAEVYPNLVKERYDAERAYIVKRGEMRMQAPGQYAADKAAYADVMSADELERFHLAKEKQYAADALERALRSKLFGFLNLNNNLASLYNSAGHGHGG